MHDHSHYALDTGNLAVTAITQTGVGDFALVENTQTNVGGASGHFGGWGHSGSSGNAAVTDITQTGIGDVAIVINDQVNVAGGGWGHHDFGGWGW